MPTYYGQCFGKKWDGEQKEAEGVPESAIGYNRCIVCGKVKKTKEFFVSPNSLELCGICFDCRIRSRLK